MGSSPVFLDPVVIPLIEGPRILDVGCGFGKWGYLCMTNYWETHAPEAGTSPQIVGIDGYAPNVQMARSKGCYNNVLDAIFPPLPFENGSFDSVLLIELIEHLEETNAVELIEEAKRVACNRVIISTPNFPDFRPGHETLTGFNELEAHTSYWNRRRLRQLGFTLYGVGLKPGSRYWRGILRRLGILGLYDKRFRPCLSSLSLQFPCIAENIIGVWKNENCDQG
jgi:SAM-dependent methyltransferase